MVEVLEDQEEPGKIGVVEPEAASEEDSATLAEMGREKVGPSMNRCICIPNFRTDQNLPALLTLDKQTNAAVDMGLKADLEATQNFPPTRT